MVISSMACAGVLKSWVSYEEVKQINPRVIYCGTFGFGSSGPYADRPA